MEQQVALHTEYIKLDNLLKYTGICTTGGEAKLLIASGQVLVNDLPCFMRGKKLRPGDLIQTGKQTFRLISL